MPLTKTSHSKVTFLNSKYLSLRSLLISFCVIGIFKISVKIRVTNTPWCISYASSVFILKFLNEYDIETACISLKQDSIKHQFQDLNNNSWLQIDNLEFLFSNQ